MQMMYDIIAEELKNSELKEAHPLDYLNFYCLGNRERCKEEGSNSGSNRSSRGGSVMMKLFIHIHIQLFDCVCSFYCCPFGRPCKRI